VKFKIIGWLVSPCFIAVYESPADSCEHSNKVYYLAQPTHDIYINNEFLYCKYTYMFLYIRINFRESYFLFACSCKISKMIKSIKSIV